MRIGSKGTYTIVNTVKYIGKKVPVYRSSWEHTMFQFCDQHAAVLQWASEPFSITYYDPLTGKNRQYWPDIFMVYLDKDGVKRSELIEIKPMKETMVGKSRSKVAQAAVVRNHAKWNVAMQYCAKNGIAFRVITENQIFGGTKI